MTWPTDISRSNVLVLFLLTTAACFADSPNNQATTTGDATSASASETSTMETGNDDGTCPPGDDGCACYPNGTCNGDLLCDGGHCIQPDCLPGVENCPCLDGQCFVPLTCMDGLCRAEEPSTTSASDDSTTGATDSSDTADATSNSGTSSEDTGTSTSTSTSTSNSTSSSSGMSTSSSTTGGGKPTLDPDMYKKCFSSTACSSSIDGGVCAVLNQGAQGGFCTAPGCEDPLADCYQPPGVNAVPTCASLGNDKVCVLKCSLAEDCPTDLQCKQGICI